MPDISRSDSNRSDASRPRVSFNRDVHVKRINGPRTVNAYSLSSDGTGFVPTSVHRERPKTKRQMTKEAEAVLKQVDKLACVATSNVKLDLDQNRPKPKKKRKESFLSFNRKSDKSKTSSSDFDSASSQEYRIYKVNNSVADNNLENVKADDDNDENKGNVKGVEKKLNNFMSLDRKKLKKDRKNKNLEYLSLEKENKSIVDKKEKWNNNIMSQMWDRLESRGKKSPNQKEKPKIVCDVPDDKSSKKKQLSPIIESPGIDYFEGKKEKNVEKMIKKLTERSIPKLEVKTGPTGVKTPEADNCHNENRPFSYTNGPTTTDKNEVGLKLGVTESLDGKEDSKSTSPTRDVIYAQVVVSGRDGNVQKTTVHARIPSNEVGRVVGDSDSSQVGSHYKTEYETVNSDEMWKRKSDFVGKRETFSSSPGQLYGENPGRRDLYRRKSIEIDRKTPSPLYDSAYAPRIKVAPKYDPVKRSRSRDKSPSDLRDLSIRREILLSRSESQAKERYNSLKRFQQPIQTKRKINGIKTDRTSRYLGDDIKINDKFSTSLRKIPKDVELIEPVTVTTTTSRNKRESKLDGYLKEKEQEWKSNEKIHSAKPSNENNLLQRLSKIGKSKSFIEDKSRPRKQIEKVRSLFKKRKEEKGSESEEDPLSSRYIEYRGSDIEFSDRSQDSSPRRFNYNSESSALDSGYAGRKRLSTPTTWSRDSYDSTATLTTIKNNKNKEHSWLKSLDRLTKKGKQRNKSEESGSELTTCSKPTNLRFFGDTDQESTNNEPDLNRLKLKYGLHRGEKSVDDSDEEDEHLLLPPRSESRMTDSTLKGSAYKYKSKYDLDRPDYGLKQMNHTLNMKNDYFSSNLSDTSTLKNYDFNLNGLKYGPKISRSLSSVTNSSRYGSKERLGNLKRTPTITVTEPEDSFSRRVKSYGNLYSPPEESFKGRRRIYDSSAESTTEGDSSQHSAKSMIYLHAATVGDIPQPKNVYRSERRSQSREELSSIPDSTILAPNKKTLSRSISVLAPWRPKHYKEDRTLHYDSGNGSEFGRGKPPTGPLKSKRSLSRERKPGELRFNTLGKENRRQKDLLR